MASPGMPGGDLPPEGYEAIVDNAFNSYAGPFYRRDDGDGALSFLFVPSETHLNQDGSVHGGALMTFADVVLGNTVHQQTDGRRATTVSINTDLVAPAAKGDRITADARVTRRTRSVLFVSGELYANGTLIMTASGLWKILGAP